MGSPLRATAPHQRSSPTTACTSWAIPWQATAAVPCPMSSAMTFQGDAVGAGSLGHFLDPHRMICQSLTQQGDHRRRGTDRRQKVRSGFHQGHAAGRACEKANACSWTIWSRSTRPSPAPLFGSTESLTLLENGLRAASLTPTHSGSRTERCLQMSLMRRMSRSLALIQKSSSLLRRATS